MTRIWQTGFECYDLDVFTSRGADGTSNLYIGDTYGYLTSEIANSGVRILGSITPGQNAYTRIDLPAALRKAEFYTRFMGRGDSDDLTKFSIRDDLGNRIVHWDGTGEVWILEVSQGVVLSALTTTYKRWEVHLKVHDTEGLCEIKCDGVTEFSFGPGDTKSTGTVLMALRWGCLGGSGAGGWWFDDVAINDTVDDGRGNDTWCGPGKILGFRPCSFPGVEAWTPVPAAGAYPDGNWARVDDGVPDDIATYVHSDTPGTIDYHVTENIPSAAAIIRAGCVSHNLRMRLATAGAGEVQPYSARDGHFQTGDAIALLPSWEHYQQMVPTEPDGAEWTKALFDNTQFGYRDAS